MGGHDHRVYPLRRFRTVAPRAFHYCDDASVMGKPFFVMEHVPGISLGLWHNFGGIDAYENARAMARRLRKRARMVRSRGHRGALAERAMPPGRPCAWRTAC